MTNTDMFFDIAKNLNNAQQSSSRYGKLFALKDILSEIETLKNIDTATKLKIKMLIQGKINGIKKDIKNNQVVEDPFLDSM
jgi:hypothetical protein|tara:strand:+ start:162 stop:404 length:243 start_codon:yes stop_codon:yes gene_type:complete